MALLLGIIQIDQHLARISCASMFSCIGSSLLKIYSTFMCVLIPMFSVGFTIMRTLPQFKAHQLANETSSIAYNLADDDKEVLSDIYWLVEISVIGIFFLELFLRFLCWPAKCQFFSDLLNWADAAGIFLPLLRCLSLILPIQVLSDESRVTAVLTAFISFRLFRIFRIWRCFRAYRSLMLAIRYSVKDLFLSLGITFMLVVTFSLFHYAAKSGGDVTDTLWLSVITLTSVGYGDITPKQVLSKVLGAICLFATILIIVLPTASLVNNYATAVENLKLAAVLRKSQPIPPPSKEVPVDLNQPGTPMYPVLPPDSEHIPIVNQSTA
ncbi:hypothetical protein CAPTEDRAFT_210843 [Capitella teleta]|uniref:Ion transport domain-containing protein n=1 Tax=Capitella teleta TaxID=283909 RepID=R7U1Y0_CAPTE|nr:hypothetical protein CAPTEDRAFT_210843 [Capitella teleta]|eukprot:ELT99857.1 hypothetical protein CAPTEDRAFT_210843 [Capitella teleta]